MTFAAIELAIQQRVEANWTATEVEWQNTEFDPKLGTPFVKVTLLFGDENIAGFAGTDSGNMYRKVGVVFFSIFVPPDSGTRLAYTHADNLIALFRGQEVSGIRFRGVEVNEVGEGDGWFQVNVSIAFEADEVF